MTTDRLRILAAYAGRVATVLALVAAIAGVGVLVVLPRVVGGAALTVLSGSMQPTLPVGSVVVVRPVDPADVAVGDVITYQRTPNVASLTTHRVVETSMTPDGRRFVTKGDANPGADVDPVVSAAVRGRVWFHVPLLGHAREAVGSGPVLAVLATLVGLLLLADRRREPGADDMDFPPPPAPTSVGTTGTVERQLVLATVVVDPARSGDLIDVVGSRGGVVVRILPRAVVVSLVGTPAQVHDLLVLLGQYGEVGARRSGVLTAPPTPTGSSPGDTDTMDADRALAAWSASGSSS